VPASGSRIPGLGSTLPETCGGKNKAPVQLLPPAEIKGDPCDPGQHASEEPLESALPQMSQPVNGSFIWAQGMPGAGGRIITDHQLGGTNIDTRIECGRCCGKVEQDK